MGLPANDRALTARVASICILCGKGVYRLKKDYLPCQLANKIYEYIENSESTIFLTNTLFSIFEEELLAAGIDNKYFLQAFYTNCLRISLSLEEIIFLKMLTLPLFILRLLILSKVKLSGF